MKKILFVCNNLDHGGISRSLVSLLREIHRDYAVDLLLFHPWGPYLKDVPEDVRLLPSEGLLPLLGMTKAQARQQSKRLALLRAFSACSAGYLAAACPSAGFFPGYRIWPDTMRRWPLPKRWVGEILRWAAIPL